MYNEINNKTCNQFQKDMDKKPNKLTVGFHII